MVLMPLSVRPTNPRHLFFAERRALLACLLAIAAIEVENCFSASTAGHGQGRLTSVHSPVNKHGAPSIPLCTLMGQVVGPVGCPLGSAVSPSPSPSSTTSSSCIAWPSGFWSRGSVDISRWYIRFIRFFHHEIPPRVRDPPSFSSVPYDLRAEIKRCCQSLRPYIDV